MLVRSWTKSVNGERLQNILREFDAEIRDDTSYEFGADLDIVFGSWKDRDVEHHNLKREIIKKSKNVLVLETPLLNREAVQLEMPDNWFRVGLNGFMGNADYYANLGGRMVSKLPTDSYKWQTNNVGDYILLVMQIPGDASLDFTDINEWAKNTVTEIRKITDRDIVIRTPQIDSEYDFSWTKGTKGIYFQRGTYTNIQLTLDNAYATITYSSGMGVESILSGVRTYVASDNGFKPNQSALHDVISTDYVNFKTKLEFDDWYYWIAGTQWHLDEIKSGKCLNAFKEMIK